MKKLYSFLIAVFLIATVDAQVIYQTDFSSWTGTVPNGWVGTKTNLAADSIIQVSTGSLYGTSSVRLVNSSSSHKRFSTQPFSVAQGDTFEIRFWVKGKGDVRTGIFDNKQSTGNFGYHYNSYITVNSSNWVMYSQNITADTTWNAAEFIFSLRNTDSAQGHIQIDSAAIMVALPQPPQLLTIYAIQGQGASSPYVNQTIITKGVVTGFADYQHPTDPNKDYRSYFLQDGDSAWTGIWVSDTVNYNGVNSGDSVTITAEVNEFFGYTRLKNITSFTKVPNGPQPVPVQVSTADANDEKYEGVLIEVNNAVVVDTTGVTYGNFAVFDGSDTLLVDDIMYGPSNGPFLNDILLLRGCMFYSFNKRYLLPRKPSDFTWVNSIQEELFSEGFFVYPNPNNGKFLVQITDQNEIKNNPIKVYNLIGEEIFYSQIKNNNAEIDLKKQGKGIYFIQILAGEKIYNKKIVVE